MPGVLQHSPADVVRRLLIGLGHGSDPSTPVGTWPVYCAVEPNAPDNCVTVADTEGRQFGREMAGNERQEHHGIQVRVRASTYPDGYEKAREIAVSFDADVWRDTTTVSGTSYCVHSVTRTSDVLALGLDRPGSSRHVFTVNAVAHIRQAN